MKLTPSSVDVKNAWSDASIYDVALNSLGTRTDYTVTSLHTPNTPAWHSVRPGFRFQPIKDTIFLLFPPVA
jgi:hypothetical protein